jgi:hypothetical protein
VDLYDEVHKTYGPISSGVRPSEPTADDVCWITPVQGKDFNYEDTFLAG